MLGVRDPISDDLRRSLRGGLRRSTYHQYDFASQIAQPIHGSTPSEQADIGSRTPTLLLERAPALLGEGLEHEPRRGLGDAGVTGRTDAHGRLTLDELVTSVWEGLAVRGTVSCPVCGGAMRSIPEDDEQSLVGACRECGARLS
jgi:hypothetical protein